MMVNTRARYRDGSYVARAGLDGRRTTQQSLRRAIGLLPIVLILLSQTNGPRYHRRPGAFEANACSIFGSVATSC
jgi:hypothetical protein